MDMKNHLLKIGKSPNINIYRMCIYIYTVYMQYILYIKRGNFRCQCFILFHCHPPLRQNSASGVCAWRVRTVTSKDPHWNAGDPTADSSVRWNGWLNHQRRFKRDKRLAQRWYSNNAKLFQPLMRDKSIYIYIHRPSLEHSLGCCASGSTSADKKGKHKSGISGVSGIIALEVHWISPRIVGLCISFCYFASLGCTMVCEVQAYLRIHITLTLTMTGNVDNNWHHTFIYVFKNTTTTTTTTHETNTDPTENTKHDKIPVLPKTTYPKS